MNKVKIMECLQNLAAMQIKLDALLKDTSSTAQDHRLELLNDMDGCLHNLKLIIEDEQYD